MNVSRAFIDRPVFAAVLSIGIFVAGLIAIPFLPVSEYPDVVPPSIVVTATYPGANPKVIAETVAAPLEEQINGVENMLYMSSQAMSDGVLNVTVTFKIGTDPDLAETQVQNRVQRALPRLPNEVRQIGVITQKQSPNLTMVVHLLSPDSRYDELYLRNYAVLNIRDKLRRIPGMGETFVFGAGDYAMRVWLDPTKLAARSLTATDVVRAIQEQNQQVAAGVVGAEPLLGPGGLAPPHQLPGGRRPPGPVRAPPDAAGAPATAVWRRLARAQMIPATMSAIIGRMTGRKRRVIQKCSGTMRIL